MALGIGDNFKYQGKKPNFERDTFATKALMKAFPETDVDEGHISFCKEDSKHYMFKSTNSVDEGTGKWRIFIPDKLPANGGNALTVNGHTVESNVPANAKFTDTIYNDAEIKNLINTKVDKVNLKSLVADTEIAKLIALKSLAELNTVIADAKKAGTDAQTNLTTHIGKKDNPHGVTKAQLELGNVDNTSDINKPISKATLTALNKKVDAVPGKKLSTEDYTTAEKLEVAKIANKVDKLEGKQLSSNDYTTIEKTKLAGIADKANNYVHPTTAGNKHIPSGGIKGQVLVNNGDGEAVWRDRGSELTGFEDIYSYGIEWDITVGDPHATRIGNPLLHKSLPIQSKFRGCVARGKNINYYLKADDWSKKENGEPSVLDGKDGTVRVDTGGKFYGKSGKSENKRWVRVSPVKIDDTWIEIPRMLIDAYKCTVDTTISNTPKAVSVVNTTDKFRGGTNIASRDLYLDTDLFRTDLGKPRTNISRAIMRTYARNAESELLCYEYYKWIFYWLPVIEYANFNLLEVYKAELTAEGYHLGGLGPSVSTMGNWGEYNSTTPITPCGYSNDIGNGTGIKNMTIPEFLWEISSVNFNSWDALAATCTSLNSSDNSKVISEIKDINNLGFSKNLNSIWGAITYLISGLTDGQKVIFKELLSGKDYATATTLKEVTQDGSVTINWGEYGKNGTKYVGFAKVQLGCNIKIYNTNNNKTTLTKATLTLLMHRWRGFENIFADIYTNLEGIILVRPKAGDPSKVYTTTDPSCFGDDETAMNKMTVAGIEIAQDGWIKTFDLGTTAEIIPTSVGASPTTYKSDYHWCNSSSSSLRALWVGCLAHDGSCCGPGAFYSDNGVGSAWSSVGFRTLIVK